jgi:hypothetical protein
MPPQQQLPPELIQQLQGQMGQMPSPEMMPDPNMPVDGITSPAQLMPPAYDPIAAAANTPPDPNSTQSPALQKFWRIARAAQQKTNMMEQQIENEEDEAQAAVMSQMEAQQQLPPQTMGAMFKKYILAGDIANFDKLLK